MPCHKLHTSYICIWHIAVGLSPLFHIQLHWHLNCYARLSVRTKALEAALSNWAMWQAQTADIQSKYTHALWQLRTCMHRRVYIQKQASLYEGGCACKCVVHPHIYGQLVCFSHQLIFFWLNSSFCDIFFIFFIVFGIFPPFTFTSAALVDDSSVRTSDIYVNASRLWIPQENRFV